MLVHKLFKRPILRQTSDVSNIQSVFIYADLYRDAGLVLFVADGIQQCLTESRLRYKIALDPLYPFIGYLCAHILQINQLDCLIHLLQKRPVYLILIKKICVRFELTAPTGKPVGF